MKKLVSLLAIAAIAFTGCGKQDTSSSSGESTASTSNATSTSNTTASSDLASTSNTTATGTAATADTGLGTATTPSSSGALSAPSAESSASMSAAGSWNELRTYTYERRAEFNSSLNAMSSKVDAEIATLKSRSTSAGNAEDKQEALKKVQEAKSEFDGKAAALGSATQEKWNEAREEVADAWEKLQSALRDARQQG